MTALYFFHPMQDHPIPVRLSIIIVNYNGGELVMRCLQSLQVHPPQVDHEILVIDNASNDGIPDRIAAEFPPILLTRLGENIGFTRAFNRGLAQSVGEYVLSLDNDTEVEFGALDLLVGFLDANPNAGACGARLFNPDGSIQHTARRFPTPANALFGRRSLLTRWFPDNPISRRYLMTDEERQETPYPVDNLSAACLLVRRSVIAQVGVLDESFYVYWCDADWCFRIKAGGWAVYTIPAGRVVHNENLKNHHRKGRRTASIIDFHLGAYRFFRKHFVRSAWDPIHLLAIFGLGGRAGLLLALDWFRVRVPAWVGR